jgi:hypothetical protein
MALDVQHILAELSPEWWVQQPSLWGSTFLSTIILFNTEALTGCTYLSSAPISILNPVGTSTTAAEGELSTFTNNLMLEAANRLYELHATAITGHQAPEYVYNAQA